MSPGIASDPRILLRLNKPIKSDTNCNSFMHLNNNLGMNG